MIDVLLFFGYLALWLIPGFIQLVVAMKWEGVTEEDVMESDKILVALVVLWPVLSFALIVKLFQAGVKKL